MTAICDDGTQRQDVGHGNSVNQISRALAESVAAKVRPAFCHSALKYVSMVPFALACSMRSKME